MSTLMRPERSGEIPANYDRRWWILSVLGISQLMLLLDSTIVNIALPTAQRALHFSNADRQWIVTAYSLAFGSLLLVGGRIGDMIGRKRALVIGLVGFAAASAIGGAAVNFAMLVTARIVQGAFGALLAPSVLALMTTIFSDPRERGRAFGVFSALAGAGGALGLLVGGILTSYASWRWTLFVNLAFAAAAVAGVLLWVKRDHGANRDPVDVPGLLLVCTGLFSIVFGFSHAETTAWGNPFTIGFLVAGVFLLVVFAIFETRARYPLLPPRVVLSRTRGASLLVGLLAAVGIFSVFLFLTYYLQTTLRFSPVKTGFAFLPMIAALAAMAQVSNRVLIPRIGPKPIVPVGLLVVASAMFGLHQLGVHSSYAGHVLPWLLVLGAGFGMSVSPTYSTGTLGLTPHDAGVGSASLNTAQQVGGSIGTSFLNTVAAGAVTSYLVGRALTPVNVQNALVHSYTTAFLWAAWVFIAAAVIAALMFPRGNLAKLASRVTNPANDVALKESPSASLAPGESGVR